MLQYRQRKAEIKRNQRDKKSWGLLSKVIEGKSVDASAEKKGTKKQ